MFKRYLLVRQDDLKDCGVACLLMLIKYYDGDISKEILREYTKTSKHGTSAYDLIAAAKKVGFSAKGVKGQISDLESQDILLPCIAHVILNKSYKHYIVIYKINKKKKYLIMADPNSGIKKYTFEQFDKIWTGVLLILYPVKKILRIERTKSLTKIVINIFQIYKLELLGIFILSLFITLFNIGLSFYFKILIDNVIFNRALNNLYIIFGVYTIFLIIKSLTDWFRKKLMLYINHHIDFSILTDIVKHIMILPYSYYRHRTTGEIINRLNDINQIKELIGKVFLSIGVDLVLILLIGFSLYLLSPTLFFTSLLLAIIYMIISAIYLPLFDQSIIDTKQKEAMVSSYLVETINGYEVIKGLNIHNIIGNKIEEKYSDYLKAYHHFNLLYNNQLVIKDWLNQLSSAVILLIGSILIIKEQLSLGTLLSFNALMIYFLEPIKSIIDLGPMIKYINISIRRLLELYDIKGEVLETNHQALSYPLKGKIVFNNLTFTYNEHDIVLNNLNLVIKGGSKVLIVGASGTGKSTLLKLIMKCYQVNNNQLLIDDVDINNYSLNYLRDNICYVSQTEMLFTDSIYNNIVMDRECSYEQFLKLCQQLNIDQIYKDNPLTVNMLIEENGFNISGGERQRLILARTILKDASIYLLDESLSEIDIDLERKILINIFEMMKNKTIILVSHRLNNKDLFDNVIYLNNGTIERIERKR
ncbi:MAG: peptidase domain-containing ABC transporter [Bacilli bacterium]